MKERQIERQTERQTDEQTETEALRRGTAKRENRAEERNKMTASVY